ncbi:MAG: acyl-[ACP]--phospholipid O-acyltransferase [Proteobacteria bacterium]|nr:MAG: acyl-[ACP]--phospholipid O-acyltransferase [Pseudomonadota bacterium]
MWDVLRTKGFIAFITMAFLNAFVDLGHKIIIQNTIFKIYDGKTQIILTAIVNALILLPFIMMFTPTGFLADKFPKVRIMRYSAWAALALTLLITLSYYMGWFWFGFSMTFLLALQSAFYSPAKLGYIRELIGETRLAQGNALAQSTVMIAILLGTFFFSVLFEISLSQQSFTSKHEIMQLIAPLGWVLVILTATELWSAYRLPHTRDTDPKMRFDWTKYLKGRTGLDNIKVVKDHKIIWLSIMALSVFWSISQVVLATYPAFSKEHLNLNNTALVQGLMACAGIGIMLGSLLAGRLSRYHIETGLIPIGAIGIMITVSMLTSLHSTLLQAANFLMLGIMGGLFIVPLNALMQYHAPKNQLGRVLACFNLIDNLMMLGFLGLTIVLAWYGISSLHLFTFLSLVVIGGAIYTVSQMPQSLLRFVISRLFHARYRLKVLGFENLPTTGGVLLLGNHISWIDWALVQMASPRQIRFVMEKGYYERWYLKGVLKLFGAIPIQSGASEFAINEVRKSLQAGEVVCLFPEGTLSRTGQLTEFKRGFEKAAKGTGATIIPFYLYGLWGSRFSRSSGFLRETRQSGFKRDIIVSFGKAMPDTAEAWQIKHKVFELSFNSWREYSYLIDPIPINWLRCARRLSFRMAATDVLGEPISNHRFMIAVFSFAAMIKQRSPEQNIGLLLPTSIASAIANMAVMTLGKTVVNLNYTASSDALRSAIAQAEIPHLYTSKKFLQKLLERGIDIKAILPDTPLIFMEDIKENIPKSRLLISLLSVILLPTSLLQALYIKRVKLDDTAAILFSSGSEGAPKGVELTHRNLASNARQVADMLNIRENDVLMGTLPAFHAFGLLTGIFMPLSEGIPLVCHPDPTDSLTIAKGIARYDATILFGTATFFRFYARNQRIHPMMLQSLRYVVAGAEKLSLDVRQLFTQRFNKPILEGYGTTETSPVASVNIPDQIDPMTGRVYPGSKEGTVGMPLPGTSFRIVDPDTLQEQKLGENGLILIGGPQIMKAYLHNPEKTAQAIIELDGYRWYKSGDKGHLDEDGFLTIVDRYSRFAKIGGEMISLTAVEHNIRQVVAYTELDIMAVNLPDAKKGEKIVLLLGGEENPQILRKKLLASDINPLMLPQQIYAVDEVPKLGSGKADFARGRQLASKLQKKT